MYTLRRTLKKKGFENLSKRSLYDLFIRTMLVLPLAWNRIYKRLHFGDDAAARYGYAPRQGERAGGKPVRGSYTAKKLRLYGHTRALEFSGRGRAEALSNDFATAGRRHGGQLWARAALPRVFNLRNPKGRTNPAKEITTVLPAEQRVLEDLQQEKLNAEFRRHSGFRG